MMHLPLILNVNQTDKFSLFKVMQLSQIIKANNSTAPAASLHVYYEKKKLIKTFIIVTDEGENGSFNGYR